METEKALATMEQTLPTVRLSEGEARSPASVGWREVLETWLDATTTSANTRHSYSRAAAACFEWLTAKTVWEVSAALLARYRALLVTLLDDEEAPLAPATVALRLTALRSFFRFASTVGASPLRPDVIAQALKGFKYDTVKPYEVLSQDEQIQLLEWMEQHLSPRDRLMVELMLHAGLRVSEVVRLRRGDLSRDEQGDAILRVRRGKGRKDRLVPLLPTFATRLEAFVDGADSEAHVFRNPQGTGLTTRRVQQVMKGAIIEAGLPDRFSPHSLRHTFAINLLRGGVSIKVIQALLGHASQTTTERYLDHLRMDDLKKAVGIR